MKTSKLEMYIDIFKSLSLIVATLVMEGYVIAYISAIYNISTKLYLYIPIGSSIFILPLYFIMKKKPTMEKFVIWILAAIFLCFSFIALTSSAFEELGKNNLASHDEQFYRQIVAQYIFFPVLDLLQNRNTICLFSQKPSNIRRKKCSTLKKQ